MFQIEVVLELFGILSRWQIRAPVIAGALCLPVIVVALADRRLRKR